MARQEARGKSEDVLGDFTFLYIPLIFYVHLLSQLSVVSSENYSLFPGKIFPYL